MSGAQRHPVLQGFINLSIPDPPDEFPSSSSRRRVKEQLPSNISSFRTLNKEFVWSEHIAGWRKEAVHQISPRSLPPNLHFSDLSFLEALAGVARSELNSNVLSVSVLQRLESGIDATYVSTNVPGGQLLDVRVFVLLQQGRLVLSGKQHVIDVDLTNLIETDSTPGSLSKIYEEHLAHKIQFLQTQPVMWMQFASRKTLIIVHRQRFVLLAFRSIEDRDALEHVNLVVLQTSYVKLRKQYLAQKKK